MATRSWYVDVANTKVTWGSAVVAGVATIDIYRIELRGNATRHDRVLWKAKNAPVTNAEVTAATAAQDPGSVPTPRTPPSPSTTVSASSPAYAATVTPAVAANDTVVNVGTLTGAITIANPSGTPADGWRLRLRFKQDATGSRAISWGSQFAFGTDVTTAMIPTAANAAWGMTFEWVAALSKWRAISIQRGF